MAKNVARKAIKAPVKTVGTAKPVAVKQVSVFGNRKIGTSSEYKARVDSTNRANLANDARMRKQRGN